MPLFLMEVILGLRHDIELLSLDHPIELEPACNAGPFLQR